MTPRAAAVALGLALVAIPAHASAQNAEPRITLGIGAGPVHPLAIVARTVTPTWSIDFQARLTKHLILGATVSGWHHVLPEFPVDGYLGPEFGPPSIGPHLAMHSVMFTALATTTLHRLHLSSGAAIGFSAVTAEPQSIRTLGIQGLLGAGMQLTRRLEAFAMYSLTDSSGFVTVTLIGGVRVGFRE
jgi:hypothetical protein